MLPLFREALFLFLLGLIFIKDMFFGHGFRSEEDHRDQGK